MPSRKRKGKATMQRELNKKGFKSAIQNATMSSSGDHSLQIVPNTLNYSVVSGTLHQGDTSFKYPGIQCTYISFWALISMHTKNPAFWTETDIDLCIRYGNDRYLEYCSELKMEPRMLLVNELPKVIKTSAKRYQCVQKDSNIMTGTLIQETMNTSSEIIVTIEDAIVRGFENSNSCLLVCGGQTIALAKHQEKLFLFDPHSRGKDGLLHHSGSSVLVSFAEIECLIRFVKRLLIDSRKLNQSEPFELVPVTFSTKDDSLNRELKVIPNCDDKIIPQDFFENSKLKESPLNTQLCHTDSQIPEATVLQNRDLHLYFADQKKRDVIRKAKFESENSVHTSQ